MKKIAKERKDLSLDKLSDVLKKPPTDVYVSVYTKKVVEVESMPPKDKTTLRQMMVEGFKHLDAKMEAGFKQVNTRIDNIEKRLDYNNLKPLPKENH